jgi:hypothetical protein
VKELSPEDRKNVAVWDRPSWPQEGWLRHEEKVSEYLIAADGVVDITVIAFQLKFNNHPGCANKVLGIFLF